MINLKITISASKPLPQKTKAVMLTHWGRVTHICVSKLITIGSDNGLSPGQHQAIILTNAGIFLIGALGTNVSEILIKICTFSLKKMLFKNLVWKKAAILSRPQGVNCLTVNENLSWLIQNAYKECNHLYIKPIYDIINQNGMNNIVSLNNIVYTYAHIHKSTYQRHPLSINIQWIPLSAPLSNILSTLFTFIIHVSSWSVVEKGFMNTPFIRVHMKTRIHTVRNSLWHRPIYYNLSTSHHFSSPRFHEM